MKNRTPLAATMLAILAVSPSYAQADAGQNLPKQTADMVLTNGHIYAPSGWVTAMAIGHGVILAVGDQATVQPTITPQTKVIDLKGETVLPGFHDMHVHPTGAGRSEMTCQLPPDAGLQQVLALMAECVKRKKPGEWVVGRPYEPASFGGVSPTRQMLDKFSPDNPMQFTDVSGHTSWVNSAALKLAGITRDTPDPKGGIIERDKNGDPTGILRENASFAVGAQIPPATREDNQRALQWALNTMLAQGITALDDALVTDDIAQAYDDIADAGNLKQRVRGCLIYSDSNLIANRQLYARDRFSPSCIKIILDGVPTDAHTAAMLEPYVPIPGRNEAGREKGLVQVPPQDLNALVTHFDAIGMTVKFHAAGDAAVREALDAIEAARKANGVTGVVHDVAHNSFVAADDIKRVRGLNAAQEFSPYLWSMSPIMESVAKAVGPELMKRTYPIKEALDAGVLAVPGSDWSVVPSVSPWIALETLVTRRPPGGAGEPLGAQEAISLKQAIDMFTINSARQQYNSDKLGTIERGKLADVIIIDRNIFDVPITTVHDTKVEMTIIGGEIVYDADHPFPAKP